MPAWSDICPAKIREQLPIVWSYRFDRSARTFTARLAGDRITQIFGKGFRGLPLEEAHPPEAYPAIYALCERVVSEPALYRRQGHIFEQLGRAGAGERIMLPLSADGIHTDGIFGASEYRCHGAWEESATQATSDVEEWFAVRSQPLCAF
jgi:hypothetical protein